jgi:hypothetical protein
MTEAGPHVESAEIDLPRSRRSLPVPALGAVAATWQAILRARHPDFTGLVVEVIDPGASGTRRLGTTGYATRRLGRCRNASVRSSGV